MEYITSFTVYFLLLIWYLIVVFYVMLLILKIMGKFFRQFTAAGNSKYVINLKKR